MANYSFRDDLLRIGVYGLFASPFFILGVYLMTLGPATAFTGIALLMAGSLLLAVPIAALVTDWFHSLLWPSDSAPPPPRYGIPESHAKKGLYEEAIREYEDIARKYPDELKPYEEMIQIAAIQLRDPERARWIFEDGLRRLRTDDQRRALTAARQAIVERLETLQQRAKPTPPITGFTPLP